MGPHYDFDAFLDYSLFLCMELGRNQNYNDSLFCRRRVLEKTSGIDEQGVLQWDLTLILLMCWIIVYFCIWKGPKSTGKVYIQYMKYRGLHFACFSKFSYSNIS